MAARNKTSARWRSWNGFRHQMHPFFMGLAAGEFLPVDPAIWVAAALDASLAVACHKGRLIIRDEPEYRRRKNNGYDQRQFLHGWLLSTPGAREAVHDYMVARGVTRAVL